MKKNILKDYVWERRCDGTYEVYSLLTGKFLIAIPKKKDGKNVYCIEGSQETEENAYGQEMPKKYNKFEVMEYLAKMEN
jgi:hypothetical protein